MYRLFLIQSSTPSAHPHSTHLNLVGQSGKRIPKQEQHPTQYQKSITTIQRFQVTSSRRFLPQIHHRTTTACLTHSLTNHLHDYIFFLPHAQPCTFLFSLHDFQIHPQICTYSLLLHAYITAPYAMLPLFSMYTSQPHTPLIIFSTITSKTNQFLFPHIARTPLPLPARVFAQIDHRAQEPPTDILLLLLLLEHLQPIHTRPT